MSDPTAGRPDRPRPRPAHAAPVSSSEVPDGGIPIVLPTPSIGDPLRKRPRKRGRILRTRRSKWILASSVAVIALLAGLVGSGLLSSPAPPLDDAPAVAGGGLDSVTPTPSPTASGRAVATTKPAVPGDIQKALQEKVGNVDNPLNNLRADGAHRVSISASSSRPVQVVGYLMPTSVNTNYVFGTVKPNTKRWALSTTAVGSGYLAAVFVQGDSTGASVRCTVVVDGKTTNTEATAGPYGRQVCLG